MTHPLIPQIIDLTGTIAHELGCDVVDVVFQTNKTPPVLRIDIRNIENDTSLDDCENFSRALEEILDNNPLIPGAYVLEISSPGISRQLTTDREFISFKGFAVFVKTVTPAQEKQEWRGRLQGRDQEAVYLNQKGKVIAIPRDHITKVQLEEKN
jgi:ribosome maturation factor RimP